MTIRILKVPVRSGSWASLVRLLVLPGQCWQGEQRHEAAINRDRTVDQMCASRPDEATQASALTPEIATPIVHAMLDKQYRETLDEPVGLIGDVSPRAAVETAEGREKVAEWLKFLENRSVSHSDPTNPMATYDFGWMARTWNPRPEAVSLVHPHSK